MNLWDFFDIPSWNPVTRKLVVVLVTAAASTALYLALNHFNKKESFGKSGGVGAEATPIAPEARTPARRQRRRRRSSAASSPNARNNLASSSVSASSSLESNTAPGVSAAQTVADPSSSTASSVVETHSERAVSPSVAPEVPKAADQEEQLPRTSLCACRVTKKGEPIPDTEAPFDASKRPMIGDTSPDVDYKQFEPLRLCDPILDKKTEVTPASRRPPTLQVEQSYLTPFQSILQSLEFADKHAYLIESLVDNYEWLQ